MNCGSRLLVGTLAWSLSAGALILHAQSGRTYYVSPSGDDGDPGSEAQPFRSIQHAADVVNPGDTVVVEDGIYTAIGSGCGSNGRAMVCLRRGGASGALVTFKARNTGGARLDGQTDTATEGFHFESGASFVRIEGFEIYGMGNAGGSASGIDMYAGGRDSVIVRNHIHDIGHLCTGTNNGQVGVFIQQPRVRVEANRIHDIGRFVSGENGCTVSYPASRDHGIYVNGSSGGSSIPGAHDATIVNNIFYNHTRGWAVQVYPGGINGLSVLHNTFAAPNPYQDGHIVLGANTSGARIINHVFYNPRQAAINYYAGTQTNLQVMNNVVFNAAVITRTPPGTVVVSANQFGDPLLVSPGAAPYDFHPTPASPVINAGLNIPEVPMDHDGTPRNDGAADLGAYESSGARPTAPRSLRIVP